MSQHCRGEDRKIWMFHCNSVLSQSWLRESYFCFHYSSAFGFVCAFTHFSGTQPLRKLTKLCFDLCKTFLFSIWVISSFNLDNNKNQNFYFSDWSLKISCCPPNIRNSLRGNSDSNITYPWWLLTAPERYILALGLHDNWGHCHCDWDGVEVWRVRCKGEDRCLCRQCPSPFHSHPMKTSRKPHDPHDDLQNYVHQSGSKMHSCVRDTFKLKIGMNLTHLITKMNAQMHFWD